MHPAILLGLLIGALILISWMKRARPEVRERALKRLLLGGGLALLVLLAVTGRLHWIFAAVGAAVPMVLRLFQVLQTAQLFKNLKSAHKAAEGPSAGQTSEVETRFLRMRLHHDTGAMSGEVREGRFQGRALDALGLEQLLEVLAECRLEDQQSAAILETYLDRTFGDEWRERAEKAEREAPAQGPMTRAEAFEILGLTPDAGPEDVLKAHRTLMQKLHPDRGGSNYLAAKINQAKDLLLGT
ncbi:MAG: molecular chaperone DnaJ [Gammaproteobacteria bacterium]|nr:molecular chaperone DnaJ [Gammaproteobacteria bacterium]NIR84543.1 molecular chaperone DnaJ [Gammaproteobacteria bacterium]NIR90446.1 molecular chaperone DnaJ [Gammaproteobacteria bacterium]NIU05594.1 molecular chaperone DnaJ [Gammaproteobacteria bacterium]NIV52733.1 molecular chaperone DnaJ [Gammaproteobacteria bacterium]